MEPEPLPGDDAEGDADFVGDGETVRLPTAGEGWELN
jgi:hypothetical protein